MMKWVVEVIKIEVELYLVKHEPPRPPFSALLGGKGDPRRSPKDAA